MNFSNRYTVYNMILSRLRLIYTTQTCISTLVSFKHRNFCNVSFNLFNSGGYRSRTDDLLRARQAL